MTCHFQKWNWGSFSWPTIDCYYFRGVFSNRREKPEVKPASDLSAQKPARAGVLLNLGDGIWIATPFCFRGREWTIDTFRFRYFALRVGNNSDKFGLDFPESLVTYSCVIYRTKLSTRTLANFKVDDKQIFDDAPEKTSFCTIPGRSVCK